MRVLLFLVTLLVVSCSQLPNQSDFDENEKLNKIVQIYQKYYEEMNPFNKLEIGGNNAKLPDLSPMSLANQDRKLRNIYQELMTLDVEKLAYQQQINWSVLTYSLKNQIDSYKNKEHYMPLTAESGFHVWISRIVNGVNFSSQQDYKDYLKRLAAIPHYFSQQMNWMNKGIAEGITQPQIVLEGFEESINAFIKEDVTKSEYYKPFVTMPKHFDVTAIALFRKQAKQVIKNKIMPTYQQYYNFMVSRYQPNARKNIAASSLPNGHQYYKNRLQHYTTLPMTAEEVHQIGLTEVARIRNEMNTIISRVGFKGSFADFIQFLRTDAQFYAKTPEGLLKEASYIAKKMDAKLPSLFKTLPRTPYGVIAVPENIAPKYTTGRYSGPSRDDQPGNYWVNTYRLDRRPLYVLEALTLHEAVPGHHLQGSIAREMKEVPKFRNRTYISAFGEGWGLYSEFLGLEVGFYKDPYSNFGRLTYEMWRACRLVVDTGMHVKGWSRDQAMNYLATNTALSLHNVKTEIDRYISWPGQALSYKIGELTIKRLRSEAEQTLGRHFNLREFHNEILKNGSMPLTMLEKIMEKYIEKQKEINLNKK